MLKLELEDLSALGADLSVLGFTKTELATALRPSALGLTDEDDIPALQDVAVTRFGDLWLLGDHRLLCGDATDQAAVFAIRLGAPTSASMIVME